MLYTALGKKLLVRKWVLQVHYYQDKNEKCSLDLPYCHHDLYSEISIICDACLFWYHFRCVGLKAQPKGRLWFVGLAILLLRSEMESDML